MGVSVLRTAVLCSAVLTALLLVVPGTAFAVPSTSGGVVILGDPPPAWDALPDPCNFTGPGAQHDVEPLETIGQLQFGMEDYDTHISPEYQAEDCFWQWYTESIDTGGSVWYQWSLGWTCQFAYQAPDYEGDWDCLVTVRAEDHTAHNNGRDDYEYFQVHFYSW